ncbi:helicase HerA domain-containing protein [Candidatus Bipolaricaulota bacterium]
METQKLELTASKRGLIHISRIDVGFPTMLLWHPSNRLEVSITELGDRLLVKGMKKYLVRNQGEKGRETFVRDLPALMRYMDDHLPEAHAYLGFFRDIPDVLAPGYGNLHDMTQELTKAQQQQSLVAASRLENKHLASGLGKTNASSLSKQYLSQESDTLRAEAEELLSQADSLLGKIASRHELVAAYQKHGRATLLALGYATPLYDCAPDSLAETIDAVIADAMNTHHKSVRQKLEGGQLQIYIDELQFPWLMYTAEAVGIYSPGQLDRLSKSLHGQALEELRRNVASMLEVVPAEDIQVPGFKRTAKRIAAQAFREFLKKVEVVPPPGRQTTYPTEGIWIGHIVNTSGAEPALFYLPLNNLNNAYASGVSGSGKSFVARVVAEGAMAEGVNVVVLDPSNQWVGLLFPADRAEVLKRYKDFAMDASMARGFPVDYYAPAASPHMPLPPLSSLFEKNLIISFQQMSKVDRCNLATEVLMSLFNRHSNAESQRLKTLVIIDEAHRFVRKPGEQRDDSAAGTTAQAAIDLICREGRKYGLNVFIISQTIRDFSHEVATVRLNTNTKIFLRSSDIELEYAKQYVPDDVNQIAALKTGEAFICNADLGVAAKVAIRPPFSKVGEVGHDQLNELLGLPSHEASSATEGLTDLERRFIQLVRQHLQQHGEPIILTKAMDALGITSGRQKMDLVDSLERRGLVYTDKLKKRGNPRVIYPSSR